MEQNQICITSVKNTVQQALGIAPSPQQAPANGEVLSLISEKLRKEKADRAVIYNPDAVAWWIFEKYKDMFAPALEKSGAVMKMRSVMPSVTPVCFGSMYSGVMPEVHGIMKYEKPVLTVETLFDIMVSEGRKAAIVSTTGDSISKIFLKRDIDYFIYPSVRLVNRKALQLIREDRHDLIVIYNGNYDASMHATGPEGRLAIKSLGKNIRFYRKMTDAIEKHMKNRNVLYGFFPDHGCHAIDSGRGSHGLDMEEDMNIVHLCGVKPAEK
ncbi:MAG: alkaline phosphatase family protein [Clostridia bacterium]|nr:alkaline phosphatase family protein [Clostridia bacterium]